MLPVLPCATIIDRRFAADSPDTRRRARLVAAFAFVGVGGGSSLFVSHLVWFDIPPVHVIAPLVAAVLSMLAVPVLLRTRSIGFAGHMVAAAWLIAMAWGIYLRAGLASPPLMCTAAPVVITIAISGRRAAIGWAAVVIVEFVVLGALQAGGVHLVDRMAPEHRVVSNTLTSALFGGLLLVMALAQEWLRQAAQDELAVAERHKLEAEREAKLVRENRLASVGQLAASMAHEINNPLSYVLGNLEHLEGSPMDPEANEAIRDALDGARRMRTIVRDLKTYARDDDERLAPLDVQTVVSATMRMVSGEVKRTAVLRTEAAACPQVMASETRLAQVLVNLVMNASQAFPKRPIADNEIVMAVRSDENGDAVLEVRDNGAGMPPEVLARATEPFFTTKPVGVGTGLGLSVCDNLVRRFGGRMRISSAAGKGTTVTIVLPRARQPSAVAPVAGPGGETAGHPALRVLVIDDDAAVLRSLCRALKGHQVTDALGGRAALALLDAGEPFDVILCDLMMPDVAGADVIDALAGRRAARKVVLMTGGTSCPRAAALVTSGKYPVLHKPIDQVALMRAVAGP